MIKATTKQLLVFDLDGTLVDTMGDYGDKAAELMQTYFGTNFAIARANYFKTSGLPFEKQLRELYPDQKNTDEVADMFEGWKDGYLLDIPLPKATAALIRSWQETGLKVVISSNNLETYVERMAKNWPVDMALGYRPSDDYRKGEPHFATLEEKFSISRDKMLFTGDSPNDARIALACKVDFLALLTPEFTVADFEVHMPDVRALNSLDELVKYL
jgi:phosphoglycolate phosphatase-like HAD superfamily hydrolase